MLSGFPYSMRADRCSALYSVTVGAAMREEQIGPLKNLYTQSLMVSAFRMSPQAGGGLSYCAPMAVLFVAEQVGDWPVLAVVHIAQKASTL